MNLNPDICYQALLTHDRRFDGVFFVGVKTTGIYCRTVCPAKTPNFKSCTFYRNAALAERAGFRPCLRCRPELAPGNGIIDSVPRLAALAVNRIEDGALQEGTLEDLANDMGISTRHLRRVIEKEYGVSPIELAQTQRLLYAKRLLADTQISITEIAYASGFASVRRFNSLFKERYSLNPSDVRKSMASRSPKEKKEDENVIICEISYISPFDGQAILDFLKARSTAGVEFVEHDTYSRTAAFGKHKGWLKVELNETRAETCNDALSSHRHNSFRLTISESLAPALPNVVARVKRLFDTFANPETINGSLGDISSASPGLRVPGSFDGFEMAARAILGQQVTVSAATTLAGRVAAKFGLEITTPSPVLNRLTPDAQKIAGADIDDITILGITTSRASTLRSLAQAVIEGGLSLEPGADLERTVSTLLGIKGIGEWTAQYIAMRALGWPDAFPYSDLGIRKALNLTNNKEVLAQAEQWRPWRSYAAMHLWSGLSAKENGERRSKNEAKSKFEVKQKKQKSLKTLRKN